MRSSRTTVLSRGRSAAVSPWPSRGVAFVSMGVGVRARTIMRGRGRPINGLLDLEELEQLVDEDRGPHDRLEDAPHAGHERGGVLNVVDRRANQSESVDGASRDPRTIPTLI